LVSTADAEETIMKRSWTLATAGIIVALSGCNNFLDSPKAVADPNNPTVATRDQLFVGVQANTFGLVEGYIPMLVCLWMQQCAGVNSRFVQTEGEYGITAGSLDFTFSTFYTGGGLIGIRTVQARADEAGDKVYKGIAEVHEAMIMMLAADSWGDIPYREAVTNKTPAFDPQMQIYDDLLALLDKAIADLNGAGAGPGIVDMVYEGDKTKWIQAAHTLKARLYLRRVERTGNSEYTKALAEAKQGISSADNDWLTLHSQANGERNVWQQFQTTSGFGQDLVAGAALVNIMKTQNDSRLADYFGPAPNGGFGGFDVTVGTTNLNGVSPLAGGRASDPEFRQPIITYDENQLIIAEASFQLGDRATATTALNGVRSRHRKSAISSPTLADIMTEKYITLFQNPEAWSDYKRTCLPTLKPAVGRTVVPGRFLYAQTEVQTNPQPSTNNDDIFDRRNANDPKSCQ
jgi:hypothetical protein